ncbi:transposase [Enterobacter cloacae]|nr:transposase [Enterobacter cloacae]
MKTDHAWNEAWQWLCEQRKNAPSGADIWHLRWQWPHVSRELYHWVMNGQYRLSPLLVVRSKKESLAMWSARDALVLKWVALQVADCLPQPERCMHLKGRGARKSIREVSEALHSGKYAFIHRTDIRGYYEHIRKKQVMSLVNRFVSNEVHRNLIKQYVYYSVEDAGEFHTPENGIMRGCALSPLIGGALLRHIDGYFGSFEQETLFYTRYMDDFLLLTSTRWQLRRCISRLAEFFEMGGFTRHPEKTQTGRIEKGFDWLGIWYGPEGPTIAPRALQNHRERSIRLFEQARRQGKSISESRARVKAYESRWQLWANDLCKTARLDCPE